MANFFTPLHFSHGTAAKFKIFFLYHLVLMRQLLSNVINSEGDDLETNKGGAWVLCGVWHEICQFVFFKPRRFSGKRNCPTPVRSRLIKQRKFPSFQRFQGIWAAENETKAYLRFRGHRVQAVVIFNAVLLSKYVLCINAFLLNTRITETFVIYNTSILQSSPSYDGWSQRITSEISHWRIKLFALSPLSAWVFNSSSNHPDVAPATA